MRLFLKIPACALLAVFALSLSDSEAPAQDRDSGANPKARVPPQLPPVPPSPIEWFRKLLDATPAEREQLLAGKSAESRRVLTNNIRTYLALTAGERELRLRTMEFRYHLTPLLQAPASNRVERLALVPAAYRQLVRERLADWDRLDPGVRNKIVESGRDIGKPIPVVPPMPPLPVVRSATPRGFTSNQLAAADTAQARLTSYSESKRREIAAAFERLFDLPAAKKDPTLASLPLSPAERARMEKTLDTYRQMTPVQRGSCVNAFKKLAELSPAERRQFLLNAEAWQAMSAADRERWRHIVHTIPPMPPLPPGFGTPPLPPLPPPAAPRPSLVASNAP